MPGRTPLSAHSSAALGGSLCSYEMESTVSSSSDMTLLDKCDLSSAGHHPIQFTSHKYKTSSYSCYSYPLSSWLLWFRRLQVPGRGYVWAAALQPYLPKRGFCAGCRRWGCLYLQDWVPRRVLWTWWVVWETSSPKFNLLCSNHFTVYWSKLVRLLTIVLKTATNPNEASQNYN